MSLCLAYHCSNDNPVEASPEKAAAFSVYAHAHAHAHAHERTHAHVHASLPVPGYARAEAHIAASLAAATAAVAPSWAPPALAATPLPLSSVRLLPGGRAFAAQNQSVAWMHALDADRLLYSFRATANLSTGGAKAYGGWEDPGCLLRGHIAGGHWLSAAALLINGTDDAVLAGRAGYLVAELAKCQAANTAKGWPGYLSAFPPDHFDRLESNTQPIWAPYYTIHKILRGLYDMHTLAADPNAAAVAQGMMGYFAARIQALIADQTVAKWYAVMNIEHGGMNEVAWLWHTATGSAEAAYLARVFDEPCWLGPLSLQADILTNEHANTHLPIVIGAAAQYEGTGDVRLG